MCIGKSVVQMMPRITITVVLYRYVCSYLVAFQGCNCISYLSFSETKYQNENLKNQKKKNQSTEDHIQVQICEYTCVNVKCQNSRINTMRTDSIILKKSLICEPLHKILCCKLYHKIQRDTPDQVYEIHSN